MANNPVITADSIIRNGKALYNQNLWFDNTEYSGFNSFSRLLYKKLNLSYPKFYKMDNLCKLAFLSTEILFIDQRNQVEGFGEKLSVVIGNRASSLDTDRVFNDSISSPENFFPSPSVFVYTLPNITIGEICIKNLIKGENAFFIFDRFDSAFMFDYVTEIITEGRAEGCICGWCNFDNGLEDSFFMMVEKDYKKNKAMPFSVDNINKLYNYK